MINDSGKCQYPIDPLFDIRLLSTFLPAGKGPLAIFLDEHSLQTE